MSLKAYEWSRLVALKPNASVVEAARALEHNRIGAVVVQSDRQVVGIVTDRDLAIRVIGQGLDARDTTLAQVMSREVVTLPPDASRMEAIRLMRVRGIRRIPLVAENGIVGIVTLDDLLAEEAAPPSELAEVVKTQVGDGGPAGPTRRDVLAAKRRASRLEASYRRFVRELRAETGLESEEQADTAGTIVISHLVRRLTPNEAADLIAQLPLKLAERFRDLPPGPDKQITPASIAEALAAGLAVDATRAGELIAGVARTLEIFVSPGQMEDVRSQLPRDLRAAFTPGVMASER